MALDLSVYDKIGQNSLAKDMQERQLQNAQLQATYGYKQAMLGLGQERIDAANGRSDEGTLRALASQLQDPTQAPALFQKLYGRAPVIGQTQSQPTQQAPQPAAQSLPPVFKDAQPPMQGPTPNGRTLDSVIPQNDPVAVAAAARAQFQQQNPDLVSPVNSSAPPSLSTPVPAFKTNKQASLDAQYGSGSPQARDAIVQAIGEGRMPIPAGFALKSPYWQAVMADVATKYPQFDANDIKNSLKFGTGKQGDQIRSFSVALSHLDTLGGLADALKNNDVQALNAMSNKFNTQFGQPAPNNFDAAKQIVGDEIIKAVVGAGGGQGDREAAQKTLNAANSPEQLKGVINTYKALMAGQLGGFKQQYEQTTGKKDFMSRLSPEAQSMLTNPPPATAPEQPSGIPEGTTATNPKTGQKIVRKGGKWMPL